MATRCTAGLLVAAGLVALLPACSSSSAGTSGLHVVASTDVYADIARTIAGGHAEVSALITGASQDPHSFEADARDQLAVSRADVLVENGGGYDDFMGRLRLASAHAHTTVINVVKLSGKTASAGHDLNEHVWYDLPTVARFVTRLAVTLGAKERKYRAGFAENARSFIARLEDLERDEAAIRARFAGQGVAITEPVPLYLLTACGLVDRTPSQFSTAVEGDAGVSARVLQQTLALFGHHGVRALVYNNQTSGPETTAVIAAARKHDVPVVPVTETLPAGEHYLSWMRGNLTALKSALAA